MYVIGYSSQAKPSMLPLQGYMAYFPSAPNNIIDPDRNAIVHLYTSAHVHKCTCT